MNAADEVTGGCACGAVRYRAVLKPGGLHACHCGTCRRIAAGPYLGVDAASLTFENEAATARYRSSDWASRIFCPTCGSALAWVLEGGGHITLAAFTLDDPPDFALETELFIDAKPTGYAFAGETHKLTGAEVAAMAEGENG